MWTYSNMLYNDCREKLLSTEIERLFEKILFSEKFCFSCGANLEASDLKGNEVKLYEICKFCPYCGTENGYFDELCFSNFYKFDFDQAKEFECDEGHPRFRKIYDLGGGMPFCNLCGKLLVLLN